MAIIDVPPICAGRAAFGLVRDQERIELMGASSVVMSYPGRAFWHLSFPLAAQPMDAGRIWSAALTQLSDIGNQFLAGPPGYTGPSSGYTGPSPLVNGTGHLGLSLPCSGALSSALVARAGDFISVNGELKQLTADATSAANGEVDFHFEPALRAAPPADAPVEVGNPRTAFALAAPNGQWRRIPRFYQIQIDAIESP